MRIKKFQLVGLAVALASGVGAKEALANDVTINTATTTPLETVSPDGVSPGDVTIGEDGAITVDANEAAVTVNSNNDVTNQAGGELKSSDADNSTGILITGGFSGAITNAGSIALTETYALEDTDDDDDLDGDFAAGTNRNGILLTGGTFTGDIINTGSINIEGNNSAAIRLDALLDGDLLINDGNLALTGDDGALVAINGGAAGGVTGDVIIRGSGVVRGENTDGVRVDGVINGELRLNDTWTITGFHSASRPEDTSDLDPDDLMIGGSVLEVRRSVLGGITIEGPGVENDEDDDGDGETETDDEDADDNASAVLTVFGSAPVILIDADASANLVLGPNADGWGLQVRGTLTAQGIFDGIEATALRIEGDSGGSTVTTANGVAIDSAVTVSAFEANAYGVVIGENATVPTLLNRRQMVTSAFGDGVFNAHAILLESGAAVANLQNTGILRAQFVGENGNAIVIQDQSNSVATITNTGTIEAAVVTIDEDFTDDIPAPPALGDAIAIDVSASTIDVTLNQSPDIPFTDDDAEDDDVDGRPDILIRGEIRFGSGNDTFNLTAGEALGALSFGAGADTFLIDDGARYVGRLADSDGALTLNVVEGTLDLDGGQTNLTVANFGAGSVLRVELSDTPGATTFLNAGGAVTFAAGARIEPDVPAGLPASGEHAIITAAGGLIGAANVTGIVSGEGTPFLYNLTIQVDGVDPNTLEAAFIMKTAGQLGLTTNQTTAFSNIIDALRLDPEAAAALSTLDTEFEFFDAYEDLMPSYASGATELAATAIQQMQSATSNRLAATRLHNLDEVSVWAQEIGYALDREPPTINGQEFRGHGFGIAFGIDGPTNNGALFGLSASFITSELEEPGRPEGEISAWFGQVNAYYGAALGPFDLDFIGGGGAGKMQSRRFVEIGDSFNARTDADWWSFEGHAAARISAPLALSDWFVITPQAALTYVALQESAYTESGGGAAIDYDVDDAFSQRLWGDVGVELSSRFRWGSGGFIAPRVFAGYRANVIDEEAERTVRFVSGGPDFTVIDEGLGEGAPLFSVGIDATNGYSTFTLAYEGELGDQIERHSLNAAIRFRF